MTSKQALNSQFLVYQIKTFIILSFLKVQFCKGFNNKKDY
ncbi:hypothetical protein Gotri_025695 [Gossypium trilobum]|uniref:Uncharacterized protein n=1 Tax=Gossypium trilobum TaxID=34281 RepID=A0A7J9FNH0_9ROSI|nr:hypothetical protein [Gossypium trilobum]